ncbi:MAG: TPM domain-containing protein, partial [Flavobacteriales bacterium]|nr:TPM domain-containing protein [Flavobacteriales bacterium]
MLLLFVLPSFLGMAQKAGQECFPERDENLLVYDVADVIDDAAEQQLNQLLSNFSLNTSNQIVVVVVPDLCGMDRAQYAIELGEAWGVGQEKEDNGVVVLVKPKTPDENGKAFIAVGRGLTAAIPAATAFDIVNNEMIPVFKQGDYAGGINAGVRVLMDL